MVIREYGTENKRHLLFFQGSCEPWQKIETHSKHRGEHISIVAPHIRIAPMMIALIDTVLMLWISHI